MEEKIVPQKKLICIHCGVTHSDYRAETHKCCGGPKIIPEDIQYQIDGPQLIADIAELFNGEYDSSGMIWIDPYSNMIRLEKPPANGTSVQIPEEAFSVLSQVDDKTAIMLVRELSEFLARKQKDHDLTKINPPLRLSI